MESFGLFPDKCHMLENERKLDRHLPFFFEKGVWSW